MGRPPEALGGRERVGVPHPLCARVARPDQTTPPADDTGTMPTLSQCKLHLRIISSYPGNERYHAPYDARLLGQLLRSPNRPAAWVQYRGSVA